MRILFIHNRYRIRGGEDECFDMEAALLRSHGHELLEFIEDNQRISPSTSLWAAFRTIWSQESYRRLRRLIRERQPDIAHIHNFFPLISPAAYYAAKVEGLPTVQTLHNYRLLCPNALLFRNGRPCEDCRGRWIPWPGVRYACYRDSWLASGTVASMLTAHRLLGTWERAVDLYIALTEFARQQFVDGGLPATKIVVKPNFVYPDPGPEAGPGRYALFVGRLFPEKGLDTLLVAWEQLGGRIPLYIVGEGPLANRVAEVCQRVPSITWLGRKTVAEIYPLIGRALFLVFPSAWYEGLPRIIIEAFAKGRPVITSDLGAMRSLVEDGRTGIHFVTGDAHDLAAKVEWAFTHAEAIAEMGREARREYKAKYTAEYNYELLMDIYRRAIVGPRQGSVANFEG
jgi:glycosyltransferase involved in cell wall biosynthesis